MTANVLSEEIELCIQSGMNDHIGKPFSWTDLLSRIERLSKNDKSLPTEILWP